MIDATRIGDWSLVRPSKRIEFARRESADSLTTPAPGS